MTILHYYPGRLFPLLFWVLLRWSQPQLWETVRLVLFFFRFSHATTAYYSKSVRM